MNIDFALQQPYWLLFLPLPWLWLYWRQRHPAVWPRILPVLTMRYPLMRDLHSGSITHNSEQLLTRKHSLSDINLAIVMSLMLFAISQPVQFITDTPQQKQAPAADVIVVVDTALSMSLSDYEISGEPVSRMSMAKLLLSDFIDKYSGHRMALVLAGNPPALWLPFTYNRRVMLNAVSRISSLLGGRITDMGATLQLIGEQFTNQQGKVVLIVSDGGTQVGSIAPQKAAQQLAEKGFSLYVLAMGSATTDAFIAANNSLIYEPVNLAMLQEIAAKGRGQLFHAQDSQAVTTVLKTLQSNHEQQILDKQDNRLSQPWYPLPLFTAMMLLLYTALFNPQYKYASASKRKTDTGLGNTHAG